MRKIYQKTIFSGLREECKGTEKLNHPKPHKGPLLNLQSKFPLPSSIWRGDIIWTKSNNEHSFLYEKIQLMRKILQETTFFWGWERCTRVEKFYVLKGTSMAPTKSTTKFQLSSLIWRGGREESLFSRSKNGKTPITTQKYRIRRQSKLTIQI